MPHIYTMLRSVLKVVFFVSTFLLSTVLLADNNLEIFKESGRYGLKKNGIIVLPAQYEALGWSDDNAPTVYNNSIGFKENQKWGIVTLDNKIAAKAIYTDLRVGIQNLYIASRKGRLTNHNFFGLITKSGTSVVQFKYFNLYAHKGFLKATIKTNGQYLEGIINQEEKTLVPFDYESIDILDQVFFVGNKDANRSDLFTAQGQLVASDIDKITLLDNAHYKIKKGYKSGLINDKGEIIAPLEYKDISVSGTTFKGISYKKWAIINENNDILTEGTFDQFHSEYSEINVVSAQNKYWILNEELKNISNQQYDYLNKVSNSLLIAKKEKFGLIDQSENVKIPFLYDSAYYGNGFLFVQKNKHKPGWQLFDSFGIKRTEFKYQHIGAYKNWMFKVKRKNHFGYIDRNGHEKIHCVYDSLSDIKNDLISVKFHDQYGIISTTNEWIVPPGDNPMSVVSEDLYLVHEGEQKQLFDTDGRLVYFTNNQLKIEEDRLLEIHDNGLIQIINFDGRILSNKNQPTLEHLLPPSEGFTGVKIDGKWGFIDGHQRLRIANRYDSVLQYAEGMAGIKILGKWGYINKNEDIVVQPNYDAISLFQNGIAYVKRNGKYGIIDKQGLVILPTEYESILPLSAQYTAVTKNGMVGITNQNGKVLITPRYDSIHLLPNGHFIIKKINKYGVIDKNGLNIIPTSYMDLHFLEQKNQYLVSFPEKIEVVEN